MAEKRKRDEKAAPKKGGSPVSLSIERHIPDNLPTLFANHMLVQRGPHESYILFFEVQLPVLTSPEELKSAKAALSVRANCVARIVVPNGVVPSIIKAFQENLARADANREDSEADEE